MAALTYDRVVEADGQHRAGLTHETRARDIVGRNVPLRRVPKHCGCTGCMLGIAHLRRDDLAAILGAEAAR